MLSLRSDTNALLVEFATLEEVESFFNSFSGNNDNILVSFLGPSIVSANVGVRLDNVPRRMSQDEIDVFQDAFQSAVGPPLLLSDPPIVLRSTTVYLQLFTPRRRLQASNSSSYTIVRFHVTGRCNGCTNSQFERTIDDAIDVARPDFLSELMDKGQESGTDYFDEVELSVAMDNASPGISECCLDPFTPPDPLPSWVPILLGVSVTVMVISICCAACHSGRTVRRAAPPSKRQQQQAREMPVTRTSTADESEDQSTKDPADDMDERNKSMESHYTYQTIDRGLTEEQGHVAEHW